jgi:hypothetical protein
MSYDNLSSVSQNVLIKFQNILRNTTQVIIRHRVKIIFSVISNPITLERQKWKSSKKKGILLSSPVSSAYRWREESPFHFWLEQSVIFWLLEIGWTDVGSGGYILVSCAHSNTSFIENHQPVTTHWQTWSHNVVSSTPCHEQDSNSQL